MSQGVEGFTAVDDVKSLITKNWTKGNTPRVIEEWKEDLRRIDFSNREYIIVSYDAEQISPFGIHADDWRHDIPISIDIRTGSKIIGRHIEIVKEVGRIMKKNVRQSGYAITRLATSKNLNDEQRRVFRNIIDVDLLKIGRPA